jgi:hypothetical protein
MDALHGGLVSLGDTPVAYFPELVAWMPNAKVCAVYLYYMCAAGVYVVYVKQCLYIHIYIYIVRVYMYVHVCIYMI